MLSTLNLNRTKYVYKWVYTENFEQFSTANKQQILTTKNEDNFCLKTTKNNYNLLLEYSYGLG